MNIVHFSVYSPTGEPKFQSTSFNARTNAGGDWQASLMGSNTGYSQTTATGITAGATTLVDSNLTGTQMVADQFKNQQVAMGGALARISTHTAAGVGGVTYTLDGWFYPTATVATSLATTGAVPTTGAYTIMPGGAGGLYIALSNTLTTVNVTDTTLPGEVVGSGLSRKLAGYSHTAVAGSGAATLQSTYTMTAQWTATGIANITGVGMLTALSGGVLVFENVLSNAASVLNQDVITVTWTVNL